MHRIIANAAAKIKYKAANSAPVILAIETSCDETACAIFADGRIIGERVYSQWRRHRQFGGVVPELASRDHLRRLLPLISGLLAECRLSPTCIAYTAGPGLAGALLAGATTANALAFAWQIPAVPVNHLTGHLLSPQLSRPDFAFPYLALLVSGGHTQLWEVRAADDFRLLGTTLDDAAGEAFDKTAVLLGLGYPGGAALEKLAATGDSRRFALPSPAQKNLNFSFSGLKTAVRRLTMRESATAAADIAAAFQHAAAAGLAIQAAKALQKTHLLRLAAVGGVAQNNEVWRQLQKHCTADLHRPPPAHCGDNAAMIALAASLQPQPPPGDYGFSINPRARPQTDSQVAAA